jgi:Flp pilus assembly protein TadG
MIGHFFASERANVALTFGMMALPILTVVGLAVDYSDISRVRAETQNLADAAAIAAVVKQDATEPEMFLAAETYVREAAALKNNMKIVSVKANVPGEGRLRVEVTGRAETHLLRMIGEESVDFKVSAEAFRDLSTDIEVVFALDTTGSMDGDKIRALRKAARSLVDLLATSEGGRVRFGVVPFANYVNVGMSNRNAAWIDVPQDATLPGQTCKKTITDPSSCRWEDDPKPRCNDGVCKTGKIQVCDPSAYGPDICTDRMTQWLGCVGSRPGNLGLATDQPGIRYSGIMDTWCGPAPVLPLTDDTKAVNNRIASMSAYGATYIPAGLLWGINMLTPGAPASAAEPFDPTGANVRPRKSLVLMTDGDNTMLPDWTGSMPDGSHRAFTNRPDLTAIANQYTATLCDNAKKLNIEVFTIAFDVKDPVTKSMLQRCATDASHFFDADDAAELMVAFNDVAQTLRKVRLAH